MVRANLSITLSLMRARYRAQYRPRLPQDKSFVPQDKSFANREQKAGFCNGQECCDDHRIDLNELVHAVL